MGRKAKGKTTNRPERSAPEVEKLQDSRLLDELGELGFHRTAEALRSFVGDEEARKPQKKPKDGKET